MLKEHNRFFLSCKIALDGAVITSSWYATQKLIESETFGLITKPVTVVPGPGGVLFPEIIVPESINLALFAPAHLISTLCLLFCFFSTGLYRSFRDDSRFSDIWSLIKGFMLFSVPAWLVLKLMSGHWVPWQFTLSFMLGSLCLTILCHVFERIALRFVRALGYNQRHILIVGARRSGQELLHKFRKCRWMGFTVAGFVDDAEEFEDKTIHDIPVIGKIEDLPGILQGKDIDQVYCALPFNEMDKTMRIADMLTRTTADFRIVPDLVSLSTLNSSFFEIDGMPVLGVRESPLQGFGSFQKRIFDVAFSLVTIVCLSWLFALIAVVIKLTSRGSILYRQRRVGYDGREFTILKFRTMHENAEQESGAVWAKPNDDRRTPLGSFLRKTCLDELPQFFNVLTGSMSVVGPRPERPEFIQDFTQEIPNYMLRHKTKAGMTGWAQVNGWRGQTSLKKRVQYDLYYIEHWSIWFDIRIIIDTFFRGFLNKNAY